MATTSPLHTYKIQKSRAISNRLHILFHFIAILTLLYYRTTHLFFHTNNNVPLFAWTLITISELLLTFIWFLTQAFRWRPVSRSVFPEQLPSHVTTLPAVDVFICTADPTKEPTLEVMNTVISAMALDYPPEKLSVYLSDDGGSSITFYAIKEAFLFAKSWLPFCNKYGVKTRCPEAYFFSAVACEDEGVVRSEEFEVEEEEVKAKYELFKKNVEKVGTGPHDDKCTTTTSVVHDRPPRVEIMLDNSGNEDNQMKMPMLVYVSREKRPSHPHRFKAGALNALLRVSGILSNGTYILVLDCDMYCNDPTSAKQAMCFHLDPKMSGSLAFVQYPQIFYNVSKNDIYDGQARSAYKTKWQGMDGLRGTVLSGTGFYLKREALFGKPNHEEDEFLIEPEKCFGSSSNFIASLNGKCEKKDSLDDDAVLEETRVLASCTYEENTKWGKEIGFSYDCLLESTFTGYLLHCRGWTSVYLYPKKPCFLGCTTIDMKDAMVQLMKWSSSLLQVGLSKFCPLTYGTSKMSILQSMCYGYFTFSPLLSIALILYGTVPQLCLLFGIPLYPKVSSPWFAVFTTVYVSSLCQHLHEVFSSDGSFMTWWNEQRIWIIKSVSGSLFGSIDYLMKRIGIQKAQFRLTNKAIDKEKLEKYEKGKFDFQGAATFMVPLALLAMLNLVCFIGGITKVVIEKNIGEMFGQVWLSFVLLVLSYPILEGIVTRKRQGKL